MAIQLAYDVCTYVASERASERAHAQPAQPLPPLLNRTCDMIASNFEIQNTSYNKCQAYRAIAWKERKSRADLITGILVVGAQQKHDLLDAINATNAQLEVLGLVNTDNIAGAPSD